MAVLRKTNSIFRCGRVRPRTLLILLALGLFVTQILRGEQQTLELFLPNNNAPPTTNSLLNDQVRDQSEYSQFEGEVVAYAVSITYCHPDDFMADAAAVLQHSIHLVTNNQSSRYGYQMYAFVHPDATNCTHFLNELGYQVLVKDTPIQVADIQNDQLREDITTTGCCQEREFLKLYALTLMEHPIVVHLDLDVLLLQPLDALFDAMMLPDSRNYYSQQQFATNSQEELEQPIRIRKYIPDAMWTHHKTIPITSFFTRDYNSAKVPNIHDLPPNRVNMQGGFWIVQPHPKVYQEMRSIILNGHNYTKEWGWGGPQSNLPPSHHYGVAQIQGLVSYYYSFVRPGTSVELNKCFYNNMVDKPRLACPAADNNNEATSPFVTGTCQDCRTTPFSQVRSIHLTLCQKPWWCPLWIKEPQCSKFHYEWHRIRHDFQVTHSNLKPRQKSNAKMVENINDVSDMEQVLGAFSHHCRRQGSKGYRPIKFPFLDTNRHGGG